MLYASGSESNLSIVKVTLSSISSSHKVSAQLRDRFVKIVSDALKIQANPTDVPRSIDRESIDLAVQLLANEILRRQLSSIHNKDDVAKITPRKAATALKAMGHTSAH